MKKCLTSLDFREKQVKTIPTSFFLVRMAVLTNAGEDVEKREPPVHCWQECGLVQPLLESLQMFKKLRRELSDEQPSIPALGRFSKNCTFSTSQYIAHRYLLQYPQQPIHGINQCRCLLTYILCIDTEKLCTYPIHAMEFNTAMKS